MSGMTLTNEAQEIINKTNEERIAYISEDRWIHYPQAEEIIQTLESIKTYEKNKTRVTSILLVGSSNNGKTSLLEEFVRRNPSYDYYSENSDKFTNCLLRLPLFYELTEKEVELIVKIITNS